MSTSAASRKVFLIDLLIYKDVLKHLDSFTESVDRCNFNIYYGTVLKGGFGYVDDAGHGVDEHKANLRGDVVLELYHVRPEDYVVLTGSQYRDYVDVYTRITGRATPLVAQ